MSNSLAGINLADIANKSLSALLPKLPAVTGFATDFTSEVAGAFSTVTTRVPGSLTASNLSTGYANNAQTATTTAKTVTLGPVSGIVVGFTDEEVSKSTFGARLTDLFVTPGVNAVASGMVNGMVALVTSANYGAAGFTGEASTFNAGEAADFASRLTEANVPTEDRSLVVTAPYYNALVKDAAATVAYAFAIGADGIKEHKAPRIHGLNVVEYAGLTSPSGENLVGFGGGKQGIITAMRAPAVPQNFVGEIETVADPDSQVIIQLRRWYSADLGQTFMSLASIYGSAVGVAGNLKRLISAPPA